MGRLTRFLGALTRWGLGLAALLLVLMALYVSLGRQLTPLVAEYRADIESKASAALGMPLAIGALDGRWSGFVPVLVARDVALGQGPSALRLDQVRVVPDLWQSLLHRQVRIAHLQVGGLQITAAQGGDGHWALKGLPSAGAAPSDPAQALAGLQQVEQISVLDSQLTLVPQDHAPLTFTYVGINLHTAPAQQRLDLRLTLPDGQPLALHVQGQVAPQQWQASQAQAYLSLPQSDWARWLPPALLQQWKLATFKAGGEFWLDWRDGGMHSAVVRLNAPAVKAGYADRAPVALDNLALNAWYQRTDDGLVATFDSLALGIGKARWESRLQLTRSAVGSADERWHLQADRLDLTPLTPLLDALAPWPAPAAKVVDALKVTGTARNVLLDFRPGLDGPEKLAFAANLDKVGFNAYHGAPAAGNVSGSISGDLGKGELRLDTDDFMLHLDPIFAKPWFYRHANAQLTWTLTPDTFTLIAPYIKVLGDEGKIASDFLIRIPLDHREPYMDLRVGMTDGDGRYTGKYLPAVLSPQVDEWLRTAILKGNVDQGYFQYQGSLAHDAADRARSISLFFKVRDATLAFQPGWPQLQRVDGNVFVQDGDVRVEASKGQLLDTALSNVVVHVPHVPASEHPHLLVQGDFDGALDDGVQILQEAPIGTGSIFAGWEGEGPLQGKVNLDIPLVKGVEPKVVVDFNTSAAHLKIADPALDLSQLKGNFRFDLDKGLSGQGVTGQAFGKPISAQIIAAGKPGSPLTQVNVNGQVALKTLTDWLNLKQALPASGNLPYQLQLALGGAASRLTIDSDLKGLAVDLPAPFGKLADDSRASRFSMNLQGSDRRFDASYGDLAKFAYSAPAGNLADGRGELAVGGAEAGVPADKGIRVSGSLAQLDLAPWQATLAKYSGAAASSGSGANGTATATASAPATGAGKPAAAAPAAGAASMLSGVDLKLGQLTGYGVTLDQAAVALKRAANAWEVNVDSQQVKGSARLADAAGAPIVVNLQIVRLPPAAPADPNAPPPEDAPDPLASVDPRKIPAVDLSIASLYQGDELIGAWSMKVRPTPTGVLFNDLDLGLKGLQLKGLLGWEGSPGASNSWFRGHLEGKNLGDVLKAWKFAPTVTSQDFSLDAEGGWPGSPAWISPKRYSGSLDATLNRGQFVEVEGGAQALRVFGLLNFNSIGRRLRLDFSDLLGKGLSYDRVKGVLAASNGVYVTRTPITMTGPSSNFELDGTLNMVSDQVNAKLLVTLPVTNNLPIAALLVGAPAIGGALFLVDKLLGDRVARFASVEYSVEGPWKEPKITFLKPSARK